MTVESLPVPGPKRACPTDKTVGSRVRAARVAAGLSQTQLGEALGISYQQVQKNEAGKNRWTAGMLQAAADRIGVPVAEFFEPAPAREPPQPSVAQAEAYLIAASYALAEAKAREAAAMQVAA